MLFHWLVLTVLLFTASAGAIPLDSRAKKFKGKATYFDVGLGACGKVNKNSQPIIALNGAQYKKSACGKWITIKNPKNKKSARGFVMDLCPGCGKGNLDLSPSLFKKLGKTAQGVIPIEWAPPSGIKKRQTPDETEDKNEDTPDTSEDNEEDEYDKFEFPDDEELTYEDLIDDGDDT
ncbi:hypothetical protein FRC03_010215 [Tulasnella sp. 419]|nr:hypothetical protein FRC02_012004 [Tulasnella sp. 418]KAG8957372.1 hypothetical protein FRC03_010215 [Tulasnella sp. 419]